MDTHGRRTAAVTAAFLLLTAALIAYNALSTPPLTPGTAEVMASAASSVTAEPASSEAENLPVSAEASEAQLSSSHGDSSAPSSVAAPAVSSTLSSRVSSQTVQSTTSYQPEVSSAAKRTTPPAQPDINLATATAEELCTIPKIGPVLAGRIIEYRDTYGPLSSLEELLEVKGIGDKLYQTLCQYLYLE